MVRRCHRCGAEVRATISCDEQFLPEALSMPRIDAIEVWEDEMTSLLGVDATVSVQCDECGGTATFAHDVRDGWFSNIEEPVDATVVS